MTDAIELSDADAIREEEYEADRRDRTGLPVIPKGAPPKGDMIDIDSIQNEYHTRATKRASPNNTTSFSNATYPTTNNTPTSIPLRSVATSSGNEQPIPARSRQEEEDDDYAYQPPERRQTHKRLPRKTFFTAFFLLFVGVVFSTLGLSFLFTLGLDEALPFLIIGGIGFIPGSYVSFIIYQTWKGVPGYSYDQIPSYDE